MSFDLGISRPVYRTVEEPPELKRKNSNRQPQLATPALQRGVTTSNLHSSESDDVLHVGLDFEATLEALLQESIVPYEAQNPVETLAPPAPYDSSTSEAVPAAVQKPEEKLADKKAQIIAHAQQNQWNQVLALCVEALVTSPQDLELIEIKGYAHVGLGQWTEALQCSNQILSTQSENENARWLQSTSLKKRADVHASEQRWDAACADYEVLMGICADAEILKKLAACYGHLQQWQRALHCYKNLMDRDGEQDINVWSQIGCCCFKRRQEQTPFLAGEAEFALEACKKIIAVPEYSQDAEVWLLGYFAARHLQHVNTTPPS